MSAGPRYSVRRPPWDPELKTGQVERWVSYERPHLAVAEIARLAAVAPHHRAASRVVYDHLEVIHAVHAVAGQVASAPIRAAMARWQEASAP